MKRIVLIIYIAVLMLHQHPSELFAQEAVSRAGSNAFWINLGVGGSSAYSGGVSGAISASFQYKYHLVSLRVVATEECCNWIEWGPPSSSVGDLGLLYGRIARAKHGFISLSGGISGVRGVRHRRSTVDIALTEEETFLTAGIPVAGQLFWTPSRFWGIGIYGFANWNREEPFYGMALSMLIGWMR